MTLIGLVFCCTFLVFIGNAHSQGIVFPADQTVRACNSGSQCVVIKRCPAATSSGNGRSPDRVTCGYTRGPRRRPMICCPRPASIGEAVEPVRPQNVQHAATPAINSPDCGLPRDSAQTGFVMGGKRARPGAWPWLVAIQMANDQGRQAPWCTGFLITKRHVLSAAHCFERPQPSLYELRIGHTDLREGRTFSIRTIKVHEGYRPGTYYDDIALLTLTRDADQPDLNTICLPFGRLARRDLTGAGVTVAGWGAERSGGAMSNYLLFLEGMPVVSNAQCNTIFNERLRSFARQFPNGITPSFMCAGYMEGGKDSCGGDSGGPLMFLSKGKWYAVGIVSFGYDCGKPGFPGGYTRVTSFLDWIQRNLE